jgi:hypothetical protein
MKFQTIFFITLTPWIAHARIGETMEQCNKRYGKPVEIWEDGLRRYKKSGVEIRVDLWKGVVHQISYISDSIGLDAARNLMSKNVSEKWRVFHIAPDNNAVMFKTTKHFAMYHTGAGEDVQSFLTLSSNDYEKHRGEETSKRMKEAEKRAIEGL